MQKREDLLEEKKWSVYCHTNNINGKKYIGVSSNIKRRWTNNGSAYKTLCFSQDIKTYGWDNFKHEILHSDLTEPDAKRLEMSTIAQYQKSELYNLTDGGDGNFGYKISEETRAKLCKAQQRIQKVKRKYPFRKSPTKKVKKEPTFKTHVPKPISKETREKMSQSRLGRRCSEEAKRKISEALTGIIRSQETKEKNRQAMIKRGFSLEQIQNLALGNMKPVYQININTNEIIQEFSGIVTASKQLNIDSGAISKVCNKKRNKAGGFKWEYKNQ